MRIRTPEAGQRGEQKDGGSEHHSISLRKRMAGECAACARGWVQLRSLRKRMGAVAQQYEGLKPG